MQELLARLWLFDTQDGLRVRVRRSRLDGLVKCVDVFSNIPELPYAVASRHELRFVHLRAVKQRKLTRELREFGELVAEGRRTAENALRCSSDAGALDQPGHAFGRFAPFAGGLPDEVNDASHRPRKDASRSVGSDMPLASRLEAELQIYIQSLCEAASVRSA